MKEIVSGREDIANEWKEELFCWKEIGGKNIVFIIKTIKIKWNKKNKNSLVIDYKPPIIDYGDVFNSKKC